MPDPDNSVATANQPPTLTARADTAPPQPPPEMSMDQGAPAALPGPPRPQYGSVVEDTPDRLDKPGESYLKTDSFGSKLYHGVLNALGGSQDVALTGFDPKTGAPIISTTPSTPGSQWKRIISGALTGMAAGSQVKGPGSAMRGFGAGYQAVQEQEQQNRQEQRSQAQQSFANQQVAAKNAAEVSMLTNQTAFSAFQLTREKVKASVEDTDRMNKFNDLISSGGQGTRYLQHFANMDEVTKAFRDDPSLHDSHAQGQVVAIPHVNADGQVDGVDAAYVTKGWADQKIDHDVSFTLDRWENGKLTQVPFTVPKGAYTNGEVMKLMMGQAKDSMDEHRKNITTESEVGLRGAQKEEAQAGAAQKGAETRKTNAEINYLNEHGEFPGTTGHGSGVLDETDIPGVVKLLGEGRVTMKTLSRLLAKNPTLADEITKVYPDFREGAIDTFNKMNNEFTSGKTGAALNSAGASAQHLTRLLQLNTPESHIPGSPAYRSYMAQVQVAAEELSKFYGGGKATVSDIQHYRDILGSVLPGREGAIYTTMGALADKFGQYHQQWQNALPSKAWNIEMPTVTPEAQADLKHVEDYLAQHDPKYVRRVPATQPQVNASPNAMPGAASGGGAAPAGGAAPKLPAPGSIVDPSTIPAAALQQIKANAGKNVTFPGGRGTYKIDQSGNIIFVG